MRNFLLVIICALHAFMCNARPDSTDYSKLSPYVRHMVMRAGTADATRSDDSRTMLAFVKTQSGKPDALVAAGCRVHAVMGSVFVAEIPVGRLAELSLHKEISRIEARRSCSVTMDSVINNVDLKSVHSGLNIPRAYTGEGVVMGIMDVGFDLTNPNFYSRDMKEYRIRSFWDQLAAEHDEDFVVGREYVGRDDILDLQHSADNLILSHGTHTLGIAAGSGYDSRYVGVAPGSDICLVNNAVTEDTVLISDEDIDKFTSATDALGFKYIFDYAAGVGKPCVISFSEGAKQGFDEDDRLFYEALQSLVGPGRILVASAGNDGNLKLFMQKPAEVPSGGSFIYCPYNQNYLALKATGDFDMLLQSYGNPAAVDSITISSSDILSAENREFKLLREVDGAVYEIEIIASESSFNPDEMVYNMLITSDDMVGARVPLSMQLAGEGTEVDVYTYNGIFIENELNPSLADGEYARTILSPGGAPAVIGVGATSYREGFYNYKGEYKTWNNGSGGVIAPYSSLGPTFDNRIKPEVVAPGTNVISSYSSFYIAANPDAFDTQSDVERYEYDGRTYSWNANTGTSMSSPVVGGIIALWLEANPNLSPDDVREIMAETCDRRDGTLSYPNNIYGHGEINAYRGLLRILGIDGIEGINRETDIFTLVPVNGGFDIVFNDVLAENARADVFATDGKMCASKTLCAGADRFHVSQTEGVFAVRVKYRGSYSSMLVRVK